MARRSEWLFRMHFRAHNSAQHFSTSGTGSKTTYPLPWPVRERAEKAESEPIWNKLVGKFLVRRIMKNLGFDFSVGEFLDGTKYAVHELASMIASSERHEEIAHVTSADLYQAIHSSLCLLPPSCLIHLDVESVRNMEMVGFNTVAGKAESGDQHVISGLGQKVVTSQSRMQDISESLSTFTTHQARDIALEASMARLEFRLSVAFQTREKFAVLDSASGVVIQGSNQFVPCSHLWVFGSLVDRDADYPLKWTIIDINNFLRGHISATVL